MAKLRLSVEETFRAQTHAHRDICFSLGGGAFSPLEEDNDNSTKKKETNAVDDVRLV
jgi:hypothetical protein